MALLPKPKGQWEWFSPSHSGACYGAEWVRS